MLRFITTLGLPISAKFRHLDGEELAAAPAEFSAQERDSFIVRDGARFKYKLMGVMFIFNLKK